MGDSQTHPQGPAGMVTWIKLLAFVQEFVAYTDKICRLKLGE